MDLRAIRVEPLSAGHDRRGFSCGAPVLDRYLVEQASQDARRRVAAPFVASEDRRKVLGFYTLSATSIQLTEVPADLARKLPRYPRLPAILLGRLATDLSVRGLGLGRFLLVDAMVRVVRNEIAAFAMVVDAKDEAAARFYERESFVRLPDDRSRLVRRMDDVAALLDAGGSNPQS